jgi:hypothetical protein
MNIMNIKLTYHSHASRKRKIIKARRKAKNSWSKKKNLMLENTQHYVTKMLKLGAHFFSPSVAPQQKATPMYGLKK